MKIDYGKFAFFIAGIVTGLVIVSLLLVIQRQSVIIAEMKGETSYFFTDSNFKLLN